MMRIFITGGTGFIGKFVVRRLLRGDHQLLLLARDVPKAKNLFGNSRRLSFVKGSLSNISKWENTVKHFRPDVCVHLAWEGIPDYGVDASSKNLAYSLTLFNVFMKSGCKRIVSTGSCWEYGVESGKVREEDCPNPKTPFSAAKVALRTFASEAARAASMQFVWAILFFVYGPGQKSTSLIPSLVRQKRATLPLSVKNPGSGNDFVFVDDVARAIALLATKKIRGSGGAYNVGSGRLTSVKTIMDIVSGGRKLKNHRTRGFYADISKVKREVGWRPKVGVVEGVKKTVQYLDGMPGLQK